MDAIVRSGGKRYRVAENQVLHVEKLDAGVGAEVRLEEVLMLATDDGPTFGAPTVAGAAVVAKVVTHGKGRKIHGFTYKAKKNERRRFGHRQQFTELVVQSIETPGAPRSRRLPAQSGGAAAAAAEATSPAMSAGTATEAGAPAVSDASDVSDRSDRADATETTAPAGAEPASETTEE